MPKPHNRAELGFKRPSAQLPSPEHAGLWATSWHRQPVALSLILRPGARHACPRRAALVALGGLGSTPWAAARALDLDRRLVPALTTWATPGLSFSTQPAQRHHCERGGSAGPALGGGAGSGHVEGSRVPGAPPRPLAHPWPAAPSLSGAAGAEAAEGTGRAGHAALLRGCRGPGTRARCSARSGPAVQAAGPAAAAKTRARAAAAAEATVTPWICPLWPRR